jgi:Papain-like cysteine protease AvrRpt2
MSLPWESPADSVNATVYGVKLIPQDQTMACWWASTLMMYEWRKATGGKAVDPRTNGFVVGIHTANNGLAFAMMRMYAQMVGLRAKPFAAPTVGLLANWLRAGPLWTTGIAINWTGQVAGPGHVVVIAGLRAVQNSNEYEIYVYDPWPPNVGHQGWRPISHLNGIEMAALNPNVDVTFLSY